MSQRKNKIEKIHRCLEQTTRKKIESSYTLELLESRVLLSADLAGAVQAVPVNPSVPQQAVVLNVPTSPAAGQQTFSVSKMLSKPAGSFPQSSNGPSQAATHASQQTNTVSEILAQSAEIHTRMSNLQSNVDSQLVGSIPNGSTSANSNPQRAVYSQQTELTSSPTAMQNQSFAAPVMNTLQNEAASPPVVQQGQLTLTVAEILALQTQQPITQLPTQQSVVSPSQTLPQQPSSANQFSQDQTQSVQNQPVSQGLVSVPLNQTTPISTTITGSSPTSTAVNPQLPQATVDTTMPTTTVTVRVGPHGDYTDLQTALNNVSLGTTILLEPGVSYMPSNELGYILPNKTTGSGWIVIRPDVSDSALTPRGTRATPADSAMMPKIVRGNGNLYAMSAQPGAHNYRIIGIEFMNQGNMDTVYAGAAFVNLASPQETSLASQSNHILFDRVYIHGPSAGGSIGVKFGIVLGGQHEGVINSTIEDITYGSDAIAVGGWAGAGPFVIRNNALSSSGENIYFGGADTYVSNLIPSDIEISNNYIYKPLKWRDDPAYNSGTYKIIAKNLFELKNAQRVWVDGNVFENMWPSAQPGFAMTFTPRQASATSNQPWTAVQDITITNNKFISTANGLAISGQDYGLSASGEPPTTPGGRYLINNNVFLNSGGYPGTGIMFQMGNGVSDVAIQHNTIVASADMKGTTLGFLYGAANNDPNPMQRFVLQDNLFQARTYPFFAGGATVTNLSVAAPGYIWTNNVFAGPWPTASGVESRLLPQGSGNVYPATEANVGYVDFGSGNYRLAPTSPYKGAASDGKDIGVDWDQFGVANS